MVRKYIFKVSTITGVLMASVSVSLMLVAQNPLEVRSTYTKMEYAIPMRDGVKLFTSIYAPKDTSVTYPILLTRTPYSIEPYGPGTYPPSLGPSPAFAQEGGFHLHWMDLLAPVGIGGVWLSHFFRQLGKRPLLPVNDPEMQEALAHAAH